MKQKNNYDKNEIKLYIIVLMLFSVILMTTCLLFAYITFTIREKQETYYTQTLYTVEQPCELKVTIDYDVEPVDITLYDPNGTEYNNYQFYQYEDTGDAMILSVITDSLGDWQIKYNQKRNKHLHIHIEPVPANQLFLTNVELSIDIDTIWMSFYPLYGDGTDTSKEFKCFVLMNSKFAKKSIIIYDDTLYINQPINIQCNTDYLVTSNDWNLKIITYQTGTEDSESFCAQYQQSNIEFIKDNTQ